MDTAIVVGVIMGSVVAIALVFGKTVLGVAWTGNSAKRLSGQKSGNDNKIIEQHNQDEKGVLSKETSSKLSKDTDN